MYLFHLALFSGFEILPVILLKIQVFWDVTPYRSVIMDCYEHCGITGPLVC